MKTHSPDRWVLLEMIDGDNKVNKILGGWRGGYLDGDCWRVSSGVVKTEEDGDYYLFHNHSGSIYKCHKKAEGLTSLTANILSGWQEEVKDIKTIKINIITKGKDDEQITD